MNWTIRTRTTILNNRGDSEPSGKIKSPNIGQPTKTKASNQQATREVGRGTTWHPPNNERNSPAGRDRCAHWARQSCMPYVFFNVRARLSLTPLTWKQKYWSDETFWNVFPDSQNQLHGVIDTNGPNMKSVLAHTKHHLLLYINYCVSYFLPSFSIFLISL